MKQAIARNVPNESCKQEVAVLSKIINQGIGLVLGEIGRGRNKVDFAPPLPKQAERHLLS
jgi:hypothetical protein